ncbi:MAG: hypothetical protein ACE37M_08040 [Henriciella sp.]
MRAYLISAVTALALTACDQVIEVEPVEPETPPPVETAEAPSPGVEAPTLPAHNAAETKTATIDWAAARQDYAARDIDDDVLAQVASGSSIAVPVLLPDAPFGVAAAGSDDGLQFRPLADGYFAVMKGETYDMVINGTDKLVALPDGEGAVTDSELAFEETMTGAQVSFSRYGASYLVEFMCHDPATAMKGSCISEDDALAEVEALLISGTQ